MSDSEQIRFHLSGDKLDKMTWAEWEALEMVANGFGGATQTRLIMMKFMVDEAGEPLDPLDASKRLRSLTYNEVKDDLVEQFATALREAVLPKESEN